MGVCNGVRKVLFKMVAGMYYQVKGWSFYTWKYTTTTFLKGFKNVRTYECPIGIKTIAFLWIEEISLQEKQVDL